MRQVVNAENKSNQRRPRVILISNLARDSVPNCSLPSAKMISIESGSFRPRGRRCILVQNSPVDPVCSQRVRLPCARFQLPQVGAGRFLCRVTWLFHQPFLGADATITFIILSFDDDADYALPRPVAVCRLQPWLKELGIDISAPTVVMRSHSSLPLPATRFPFSRSLGWCGGRSTLQTGQQGACLLKPSNLGVDFYNQGFIPSLTDGYKAPPIQPFHLQ